MNRSSVMNVGVEAGGTQVVAHAGLHALGRFADRIGLGSSLSTAIPWAGERAPLHDRGTVLTHAMLMLAAGGEACSDIEFLVSQPRLFGPVASDSTLYRTMRAVNPSVLAALTERAAVTRAGVWRRMSATTGTAMVVLDIDASLVQIHSENKAGTGPNYKGGFGFHPLFCFADATGEALAGLLRPGNAGANTLADHFTVLDAAVAQLPVEIAAGHHDGDDTDKGGSAKLPNFELCARLMDEPRYRANLAGDIAAITQGNRMSVVAPLIERSDWHDRLLNGSDYPLPGVVPLIYLKAFAEQKLLDPAALEPLRKLREINLLLFDFVLKRSLAANGKGFAPTVFETAPFFARAA